MSTFLKKHLPTQKFTAHTSSYAQQATACLGALDTLWLWILQYAGDGRCQSPQPPSKGHSLHLNAHPLHDTKPVSGSALFKMPEPYFSQPMSSRDGDLGGRPWRTERTEFT
ncbi:hypothetical protein FALCPG4_002773 [Fusarium falciforme]